MKRVIEIIANKQFEVTPFLAALEKSQKLPSPKTHYLPDKSKRMTDYRAKYVLSNIEAIVRCIEDIMPPADSSIPETSGSHSQQKHMLLSGYIRKDSPDLIISVSTAESTPKIQPEGSESVNGSVFMGGIFYIYDGHKFDEKSPSKLDIPVDSYANNVGNQIYSLIDKSFSDEVLPKFTPAKNFPAKTMQCIAKSSLVSIGVINIIHYEAYKRADPSAYNAYTSKYGTTGIAATIETTHGIVKRSAGDIPTLFVSPITDRYGHFDDDVDKEGEQNRIASNNAGVAVAELLIRINEYYSNDPRNFS